MADANIIELSAVEQGRRIARGELSAVDLLDACIDQIERLNPSINAVVTTNYDQARADAEKADTIVSAGDRLAVLHGLPVLVKDLSDTKGLRTTYGSRCFSDHIPKQDDVIVEKLRQAGAIILGKTNTPEFGCGANTSNAVFGATGNPYNTVLTSGGSSGGSTAALASHMTPLATGSDLGGSLRIPASFCSVVGMRPTPGLVPSRSHADAFSMLWTDGPMARNVADTALLLSGISGIDRRDPLSLPNPNPCYDDLIDLQDYRIGFSTDLGVAAIDHDVAEIFENRTQRFSGYFKESRNLSLDLAKATEIFKVLRAESLYISYADLAKSNPELISDNLRQNLVQAQNYDFDDITRARRDHTALYRQFNKIFDDIDYLICPATAVSPFPLTQNQPAAINGQPLENYYAWYAITWALTLTGCPIITLPCGTDKNNMPFGIQIIGPRYSDYDLLSFSRALETTLQKEGVGRLKFNLKATI